MRTTVDIPVGLHQRIMAYAATRGQSFSATATEALLRGMASVTDTAAMTHVSPITGLLTFNSGRPVTSNEVAGLIDEDN